MAASARSFSPAYEAAITGAPARPSTPADAFNAARDTWMSGERVDMGALASSLGVSRPTLYKWCGGREQLLTDVIWSIAATIIDATWADTRRFRGASRIVHAVTAFSETIAAGPPLHAYLQNETHAALRLLTARGGFQDRLVDRIAQLIDEEAARSDFQLRAEPHLIAYAVVRVIEGLLYNDTLAAMEPRLDEAPDIIRLIVT